jgi:hypothetical protein
LVAGALPGAGADQNSKFLVGHVVDIAKVDD